MNGRENTLRAIHFKGPKYIPVSFKINPSYYFSEDTEAVFDFQQRHPALFPGFVRPGEDFLDRLRESLPPTARANTPFRDDFGCLWLSSMEGMTGTVVEHPLCELEDLSGYSFPDPDKCSGIGPVDWQEQRRNIAAAAARGELTVGKLRHGHTFLQLCDICSYEKLLCAMADEERVLDELIKGLSDFNCAIVRKFLDMGVDMVKIPEDLGMQYGPMLSPEQFRKYIKPSYRRMMDMVRAEGKIVHMHSDGDIRTLAEDIIEGGCHVLNLQDLVNGIDWIEENLKGRVCIELDIDRQKITYGGSPRDIEDLVRMEIERLDSPSGGLMMIYGLYPGVSLENAEALADALEKYALKIQKIVLAAGKDYFLYYSSFL